MLVSHGAAAVLPDKDKFGIKFESTIPPSVLRVHLDVFLLHTVAVVFNKCLVVCVKVTPGKVLFFFPDEDRFSFAGVLFLGQG